MRITEKILQFIMCLEQHSFGDTCCKYMNVLFKFLHICYFSRTLQKAFARALSSAAYLVRLVDVLSLFIFHQHYHKYTSFYLNWSPDRFVCLCIHQGSWIELEKKPLYRLDEVEGTYEPVNKAPCRRYSQMSVGSFVPQVSPSPSAMAASVTRLSGISPTQLGIAQDIGVNVFYIKIEHVKKECLDKTIYTNWFPLQQLCHRYRGSRQCDALYPLGQYVLDTLAFSLLVDMNILLICIYQFSSDGVSVCSDPDPHFKNQLHAQSHAYIE